MRPDDLALIRSWTAAEGWNPGLHDGPCFLATDPEGFFVGELDGQPISSISCVAYGDSFGFLGLYIVKPEFRGLGFGMRTWQTGIARLGTRNVGLDGVLAQKSNYERSGFSFAYHHIRYQGEGGGTIPPGLVRLSTIPFEEVLAYDGLCFPAARPTFLRGWLALAESVALGCRRKGRLAGFGVARRCVEGFKIGPLFADDFAVAEQLLQGLSAETGGRFYLDIAEEAENPAASELVKQFGMVETFRVARMYTKGRPRLDASRVFGITTMELG
ncbi:MAG: GNAT family N-acetyltransferase [Planctomycetes bacterium]|nr:GNAT family N-acetyltransferase [Planctomycetota bacterium]